MNILYIGKPDEVGAKLINCLSPDAAVTVLYSGKTVYEINADVIPSSSDVKAVIRDRDIDTVVCFGSAQASVDEVEKTLACVKESGDCRLVYIREQSFFRRRKKPVDTVELLLESFSREYGVNTALIQTSCLYSEERIPAYVGNLLREISRHSYMTPLGSEDEYCDCLYADDFCVAVKNILHNGSDNKFEKTELQSAYPFVLSEFIEKIHKRYTQAEVLPYESDSEEYACEPYRDDSWTPSRSFTDDLGEILDRSEDRYRELKKSKRKKALNIALKIGALLVLFLLAELYTQSIARASDLQFVDMRLLLIVVSSLMFGKRYGLGAAVMCSLSSVIQSLLDGYRWYVLFYHVDNWIPIAVYFVVAILLGIYQEKRARKDLT